MLLGDRDANHHPRPKPQSLVGMYDRRALLRRCHGSHGLAAAGPAKEGREVVRRPQRDRRDTLATESS